MTNQTTAPDPVPSPANRPGPVGIVVPAVIDVALVLVFAASGRSSHSEGLTVAGIWSTAWPFLAALALMWLAAGVWRRPTAPVRSGLPIWLGTVALGMLLRVLLTDGEAPIAFIIVASTVLGIFLLGWRAAWKLIHRVGRR